MADDLARAVNRLAAAVEKLAQAPSKPPQIVVSGMDAPSDQLVELIRRYMQPPSMPCARCDGKAYWAPGVPCETCGGSGVQPIGGG